MIPFNESMDCRIAHKPKCGAESPMTSTIQIPIRERLLPRVGAAFQNIPLDLEVLTDNGDFIDMPFLFDTGTHFTTISIAEAQKRGISFATNRQVSIRGSTTSATIQGYLSPLWFSLAQLPQWRFQSDCCFTPQPIARSLLSLRDVMLHFAIASDRRFPRRHHSGSLLLLLRDDHSGVPRA